MISEFIFKLSDAILLKVNKIENIKSKLPEILVLILYPVLFFGFGIFHEPWFDEAQAWQIAKSATYHDMFFYLPHLEGHPPLWHFILSLFAKNGFPYDITLKSVSFVFCYISSILIIFKSPFYRAVKLLLPFTFFLFYSGGGIISRPYCIVTFGFCLLAIVYNKRHIVPFKYLSVLTLLALAHPFTFVMSVSLAFIWFVEEIRNKNIKSTEFIFSFIILGLIYALIAFLIFPYSEAYAIQIEHVNNTFVRLICSFFVIPSTLFLSDTVFWNLLNEYILPSQIIPCAITGIIIWFYIYYFSKIKHKSLTLFYTFLIPYSAYALVAAKYMTRHHLSIVFSFIIFFCWIVCLENRKNNISEYKKTNNQKAFESFFVLLVTVSMFLNLYWSLKSCILDVFIPYSAGREEAKFIKKYNLDKYNVFTTVSSDKSAFLTGLAVTIVPYFKDNIFYTLNNKNNAQAYVIYKTASNSEINTIQSKLKSKGLPDVIVGHELLDLWGDINKNYTMVYSKSHSEIFKGIVFEKGAINIYLKNELAKKLNLKEVEYEYKNYKLDKQSIITFVLCKLVTMKDNYIESGKIK